MKINFIKRQHSSVLSKTIEKNNFNSLKSKAHKNKNYKEVILKKNPIKNRDDNLLNFVSYCTRSDNLVHITVEQSFILNAQLLALFIAKELEKKKKQNIRKIVEKIEKEIELKSKYKDIIKGIRIECNGRLNGVDMAQTYSFKKGQTPLQTISANIDYYKAEAFTLYGVFGIKVWVCYNKKVINHFNYTN